MSIERFAVINRAGSRITALGEVRDEPRVYERSFWSIVLGRCYWNTRRVVPDASNRLIINYHNAERLEDQEGEVDIKDVLEPCYRRKEQWRDITVVDEEARALLGNELYQRFESVRGDPANYVCYEEMKDFDGEVVRKIRRRQHNKYETMLLFKIREKFRWSQTKRSPINDSAIHSYAVSLMIRDHLRIVDRHRILSRIVTRYYTPLRCDIEDVDNASAPVGQALQQAVEDTRVEENWQRFLGWGINPRPVVQSQ